MAEQSGKTFSAVAEDISMAEEDKTSTDENKTSTVEKGTSAPAEHISMQDTVPPKEEEDVALLFPMPAPVPIENVPHFPDPSPEQAVERGEAMMDAKGVFQRCTSLLMAKKSTGFFSIGGDDIAPLLENIVSILIDSKNLPGKIFPPAVYKRLNYCATKLACGVIAAIRSDSVPKDEGEPIDHASFLYKAYADYIQRQDVMIDHKDDLRPLLQLVYICFTEKHGKEEDPHWAFTVSGGPKQYWEKEYKDRSAQVITQEVRQFFSSLNAEVAGAIADDDGTILLFSSLLDDFLGFYGLLIEFLGYCAEKHMNKISAALPVGLELEVVAWLASLGGEDDEE